MVFVFEDLERCCPVQQADKKLLASRTHSIGIEGFGRKWQNP